MTLSPRDKAELALARFAPLQLGEPPASYDDLRRGLQARGKSVAIATVERCIKEAFQRGWVRLAMGVVSPPSHRDQDLEGLLAGFLLANGYAPQNLRLRVVASDSAASPIEAHAQVGRAWADELANWALGPNDAIGVASGRGVHFMLRELALKPRIAVSAVSVFSLTGSVFMQRTASLSDGNSDDRRDDLSLDADIHTTMLASNLWNGDVHTFPMHSPIAVTEESEREETLNKRLGSFLEAAPERRRHALIGLGVFHQGHRFYDAVTPLGLPGDEDRSRAFRDPNEAEHIIRPIAAELNALADKVDTIVNEYRVYFPVADVCNRFFVVDPPRQVDFKTVAGTEIVRPQHSRRGGLHISPEHLELISGSTSSSDPEEMSIQELVDSINKKTVTVTKTQLTEVNTVMLGAATWKKARPTLQLLRRFPRMISHLLVDEDMAKEMLELLKAERQSNNARL